ncbi:helix-turn-helix domain-containing protein [Nocardia goodfellowii]
MEFNSTDPRKLIRVKAASELVDVDSKTIRNWIAAGELRGFRINGGILRVSRDELLALVQPIDVSSSSEGVA